MCKCTATSWGQLLQHIIAWDFVHWPILLIITVTCHFAAAVSHLTLAGNCISVHRVRGWACVLLLTHLEPLWWAAVRSSFARGGWLMMFLGRVGPPTAESRTRNWGGLTDRLRSWKLQTKSLYGNVCRIKTLHSLQSSLLIIIVQVSRREERKHEEVVLNPSNSHYCYGLCKNTHTY